MVMYVRMDLVLRQFSPAHIFIASFPKIVIFMLVSHVSVSQEVYSHAVSKPKFCLTFLFSPFLLLLTNHALIILNEECEL